MKSSCLVLVLLSLPAFADTIVQDRAKAVNRLINLEKITVGPDDQYNAAIDPSGKTLIFTHKADLVAHLELQEIATGITLTLLPTDADSEEPSFAPDGRVSFTYYKFNARGDICFAKPPSPPLIDQKPLSPSDIRCLKRSTETAKTQRANSFWRSADEIGFVEREIGSQNTKVVTVNINSGAETVLAEGRLWSPSMRSGGHLLVFNEWVAEGALLVRHIVVLDLTSGKKQILQFALPGISGFPQVSADEKYLYFSHYMTDSNGDQIIDGNDNAVVFRTPLALIAERPDIAIFPEQLTSVESSCSFPKPFRDSVFLTCAFEGSLDIYRAPNSGIVPSSWSEALVTNALQTSRSYEDRILLLNTLQYRFGKPEIDIDQKLLSDHLFADDMEAARYYIDVLDRGASTSDVTFYNLLRIYLTAREVKKSQGTEQVGRELSREILKLDEQAEHVVINGDDGRMRAIVRGDLHVMIGQWSEAAKYLKAASGGGLMRPLERHLYFELARDVAAHDLPRNLSQFIETYRTMTMAKELTEQSQIYYAFEMLCRLQSLEADSKKRITLIEGLDHGLPAPISTLLQTEIATLKLTLATEDQKAMLYPALDKLMVGARSNYYLRRAMYVRSILDLAASSDFMFMRFIVNAWLRDTSLSDTEQSYAREALSGAAYDQAYSSYGDKKYLLMENYFYDAIGITDDLEAHFGFIQALLLEGQRSTVETRYKTLRDHGFVADSMNYVDAVLDIIDGAKEADKDPHTVSYLDRAITSLSKMNQDRDSSVRYLLLGYCYMEKMLRQADGYEIPSEQFQNANHNLMLAYDLGRDNDRVKASALMNLGILHQRAQNYGQAAKFFALRKKLNFNSDDEKSSFTWLFANALEHSHQEAVAATELASLKESGNPALTERKAFDLMTAGKFKEAASTYTQLLSSGSVQGDRNVAKVNLSYGFSLLKLGLKDQAAVAFRTSLGSAEKLRPMKHDETQLIDFDPLRIELAATGLLAQIGTAQERASALAERAKYLAKAKNVLDDWQGLVIENHVQLAAAKSDFDLKGASDLMIEALKETESFGDSGQYLGNAVFHATIDYMAHAIQHPELYANESAKRIEKVVNRMTQSYESQKIEQPLLIAQDLETKIFWSAYQRKVLKTAVAQASNLGTAYGEKLKSAIPTKYAELVSLEKALE